MVDDLHEMSLLGLTFGAESSRYTELQARLALIGTTNPLFSVARQVVAVGQSMSDVSVIPDTGWTSPEVSSRLTSAACASPKQREHQAGTGPYQANTAPSGP